jgi:anthranilate synthase component I
MFYPDIQAVKKLSRDCSIIPVSMEVYADMETPISLFKRYSGSSYCFLLESVEKGEKWGRYSFIGKAPFMTLKSVGGKSYVRKNDGNVTEKEGNPVDVLKGLMKNQKSVHLQDIPRFSGGAVGYFGYDLVRYMENLPDIPFDDLQLPDCFFMFMGEILAFDHLKQKIHIIVNMNTEGNIERNYNSVIERIKAIYQEIIYSKWKTGEGIVKPFQGNIEFGKTGSIKEKEHFESSMAKDEFMDAVQKAKEYIKNGDIFQAVISQRLEMETEHDPFNVYRVLRTINPSPYMFYLKFDDFSLVGASPEMLVRVENGFVETCPIAGTRKRGKSMEEDNRLEKELLSDEKEKAEHMMLVDLARNDVGKISCFGSVEVKNLMHVEKFSHVMHMVTNVSGRLEADKFSYDALMSVLPAGTLSGAPKIRAMEIIDKLEPVKRGVYGGAAGYIGFDGTLDSCITIRTIVFKGNKAYIQAGAGIVADSVPEREYEETLNKAKALMKAIGEAGEIL